MTQADSPTDQLVQVGDVHLFTRCIGEGLSDPLFVIHGGPDWDHSYLLQPLARLASSRRVVWFDLRGCGASSRGLGPGAYQPDLVVADIAALLDALGVARADVLGFSYGGQLAQLLLAQHPGRVARLILASTTAYGTSAETSMAHTGLQRISPEVVRDILANDSLSPLSKTKELAHRTAPLDIWDLRRLDDYLALLNRIDFSGDWMEVLQLGLLRDAFPFEASRRLAEAKVPTLILHGRYDMRFPLSHAERLHAEVPTSMLAVIEAAGHMAHWEQPDAWLEAVADFAC